MTVLLESPRLWWGLAQGAARKALEGLSSDGGGWERMSLCGLSWPVAWNEACVAWRLCVKHWMCAPRADVLSKEVLLVVARHFSGWALLLRLRHPSAAPGTQGTVFLLPNPFSSLGTWTLLVLGSGKDTWQLSSKTVNKLYLLFFLTMSGSADAIPVHVALRKWLRKARTPSYQK